MRGDVSHQASFVSYHIEKKAGKTQEVDNEEGSHETGRPERITERWRVRYRQPCFDLVLTRSCPLQRRGRRVPALSAADGRASRPLRGRCRRGRRSSPNLSPGRPPFCFTFHRRNETEQRRGYQRPLAWCRDIKVGSPSMWITRMKKDRLRGGTCCQGNMHVGIWRRGKISESLS